MQFQLPRLTPPGVLNALLMIIATLGMIGTIELQCNSRALRAEYAQLAAEYGDFGVKHPDKYKLLRLPSHNPREFRWRYYQPSHVETRAEAAHRFPLSGGKFAQYSNNRTSNEDLLRVYLYVDEKQAAFHCEGDCLSGDVVVHDPDYVALLRDHWEELEVEAMGGPQPIEFADDEYVTLLRIRVPQRFLTGRRLAHVKDNTMLEIRLGSNAAFLLEEAKQAGKAKP